MADIDPGFPGQVLSAIPYADCIGLPINALIEAATKSSRATADFIMQIGFSTNAETGVKEVVSTVFKHTLQNPDGTESVETFELPMICSVPIPNFQIKDATIELDVEVSQSAETKSNLEASGEAEGSVGWGPFSLKVKARASYSKANTRKTDTRARQRIEIHCEQAPLPEGIELLMEHMRNRSLPQPVNTPLSDDRRQRLPEGAIS